MYRVFFCVFIFYWSLKLYRHENENQTVYKYYFDLTVLFGCAPQASQYISVLFIFYSSLTRCNIFSVLLEFLLVSYTSFTFATFFHPSSHSWLIYHFELIGIRQESVVLSQDDFQYCWNGKTVSFWTISSWALYDCGIEKLYRPYLHILCFTISSYHMHTHAYQTPCKIKTMDNYLAFVLVVWIAWQIITISVVWFFDAICAYNS